VAVESLCKFPEARAVPSVRTDIAWDNLEWEAEVVAERPVQDQAPAVAAKVANFMVLGAASCLVAFEFPKHRSEGIVQVPATIWLSF